MVKLLVSFFIFLSGIGFIYYSFLTYTQATNLISPFIERGRIASNLWFPKAEASLTNLGAPDITAKAAYFIDADTGEVLYQKDIHSRLPVASLTKIMTVVVSLENYKWDDPISISQSAANMEPDHMILQADEKLSVEELLYGIFLVSANDAAEALAENYPEGRESFITQMNKKAAQVGMRDSLFINPSGLEEDNRQQYSSAYDVALISRYLIKYFPHVLDISSTPHIYIAQTDTHQDYDMYSGINLLTTYPGVMGLKTGYTPEAGLTLVTLAKRDNHKILGVLLNSENRREEAKELLDYSFKKLGVQL